MQNQQQAQEQQKLFELMIFMYRAQEEARKKLLHSLIDTEARARCNPLIQSLLYSRKNCFG